MNEIKKIYISIDNITAHILVAEINKQNVTILEAKKADISLHYEGDQIGNYNHLCADIGDFLDHHGLLHEEIIVVLGCNVIKNHFLNMVDIPKKDRKKELKKFISGRNILNQTDTSYKTQVLGSNSYIVDVVNITEINSLTFEEFNKGCVDTDLFVSKIISPSIAQYACTDLLSKPVDNVTIDGEQVLVESGVLVIDFSIHRTNYLFVHSGLPVEARESKYSLKPMFTALLETGMPMQRILRLLKTVDLSDLLSEQAAPDMDASLQDLLIPTEAVNRREKFDTASFEKKLLRKKENSASPEEYELYTKEMTKILQNIKKEIGMVQNYFLDKYKIGISNILFSHAEYPGFQEAVLDESEIQNCRTLLHQDKKHVNGLQLLNVTNKKIGLGFVRALGALIITEGHRKKK